MKMFNFLLVGLLLGLVAVPAQAQLPEHAIILSKGAVSPVNVGDQYVFTSTIANYNQAGGDTGPDTLKVLDYVDTIYTETEVSGKKTSGDLLPVLAWTLYNGAYWEGGIGNTLVLPTGAYAKSAPYSWHVVQAADAADGIIYDQIVITWTDECDSGAANCPIGPQTQTTGASATINPLVPCIDVTKEPECGVSKEGDTVVYEYCVSNCGPTKVEITKITDDKLGDLLPAYLAAGCPAVLAPDDEEPGGPDECCFKVPYVVPPGSYPGPLVNQVVVEGVDEYGTVPEPAIDDAKVALVKPCLEVSKKCLTDPVVPPGPAQFEIRIKNCGDVDLIIETDEPELPGEIPLAQGQEIVKVVDREIPPDATEVCNEITVKAKVDHPCLDNVLPPQNPDPACCPVEVTGEEGCTPGYWKNSPGCWECYKPGTLFSDVFGVVITVRAGGKKTIKDPTLMQALEATGGDVNALARHAVAALLNACDEDIAYPMSEAKIIAAVQEALKPGNEDQIGPLKDMLDMYNNLGCGQSSDNAANPCSPTDDEAPV